MAANNMARTMLCAIVLIAVATNGVWAASCGDYSSCKNCAAASTSLNCGWCAKTGECTAGTASGPSNNATCGVGGWGFQGDACTLQAQCNTMSGTSCTTCVQSGQGQCGYCQSTGRCETGNSTAALDGDCAASKWSFSVATCPAEYDPCNAYSGTCGKCESAPASLKCGFCSETDKCISGSVNGPTAAGATCRSIHWSYQSCPTDYVCASQTECGSCQHLVQVLEPVHARHVGSDPRADVQQLRDARPVLPGAAVADAGPEPERRRQLRLPPHCGRGGHHAARGILAVGRHSLHHLRVPDPPPPRARQPPLGRLARPRLGDAHDARPAPHAGSLHLRSQAVRHGHQLMVAHISGHRQTRDGFSLQVRGVSVATVSYGVVSVRSYMEGYGSTTTTYATMCKAASDSDNGVTMCQTLRAAGIMTLIGGVLSLAASAGFIVLALVAACRRGALAAYGVSMWRLQGLAHLGALLAFSVWVGSAHVVLHHTSDDIGVSTSWIMFIPAWVLDLVLLLVIRRAVVSTPNPAVQQPYQNLVAVAAPVVAYAAAYPVGQQQPQAVYAAPVGYGAAAQQPYAPQQQQQYAPQQQQQYAPQQQQQQQQAYVYPPQLAHAMPPAYAPPQPRY